MKSNHSIALAALGVVAAAAVFFAGCEGADEGDPTAKAGIDFSGAYKKGGASITSPEHPGTSITELNLSQTGTSLEAVDNSGATYKGSLGAVPGEDATEVPFSLVGGANAGAQANIHGTLRRTASTSAEMKGNWIEPTFSGTLLANAQITPVPVVNTNPPINIIITNAPVETNRFPRLPR